MSITVNTSEFNKALRLALEHTSRDLPVALNGYAMNVILRAAKLTKKSDPEEILKELQTTSIAKKSVTPSRAKVSGKAYKPGLSVYKIIAAKRAKLGLPGLNNAEMSAAAQTLIKKRKSAVGFAAFAGWQKALIAAGGRGFGSGRKKPGFGPSSADQGGASKATTGRLTAKFWNTVSFIEKIHGQAALQEAVDLEAVSMMRHIESKLAKACKEASR